VRRPFGITLGVGTSHANKTGSWRTERPVYVDRLPPCNDACPTGQNVQQWLYLAEDGSYEAAWRQLVEDNPLPAVMGRICYHPCETACNRAQLDAAVGIHGLERFLGDLAIERGWVLDAPDPDTGHHVVVVGSGPAGLAAAYHLRRRGHRVTVREAARRPGGMLRYGIPAYRLPRDVLDAELARLVAMGIEIETDAPVTDAAALLRAGQFDAVLLAMGASVGRRTAIPADDSARVLDAVAMLRSIEDDDEPPSLGRRVVVYGGGNTAFDTARTARRLGAIDTVVVYRRTRTQMPAHDSELEDALQEGITVRWLSTVARVEADGLLLERMELDETGFPQPTGEFETLGADALVLALGQEPDTSALAGLDAVAVVDGDVQVDEELRTGQPGVFACGDLVDVAGSALPDGSRTATVALGHGKRAARTIDRFLTGRNDGPRERHELAEAALLNTWYYADAPAAVQPRLDAVRRQSTFDEVVGGLDEDVALFEARRCLSCGNCFECDNCYGVCPDNAVRNLGPGLRYAFDYDYCKGCGICVEECPCGAIELVDEASGERIAPVDL
jgi:NADPH-dependent glutamate synthase beta subunit-like oxidoreductase